MFFIDKCNRAEPRQLGVVSPATACVLELTFACFVDDAARCIRRALSGGRCARSRAVRRLWLVRSAPDVAEELTAYATFLYALHAELPPRMLLIHAEPTHDMIWTGNGALDYTRNRRFMSHEGRVVAATHGAALLGEVAAHAAALEADADLTRATYAPLSNVAFCCPGHGLCPANFVVMRGFGNLLYQQ